MRPSNSTRHGWLLGLAALVASGLTGCDALDPQDRPYAWHPTNANAVNIAAMAANPRDLLVGRETARGSARNGVAAVQRIWDDKPAALGGGGAVGGAASGAAGGAASGASGG